MVKTPGDYALYLEKKARERVHTTGRQMSAREDVSDFYQGAGNKWIENTSAKYSKGRGDLLSSLSHAAADYKTALKNTAIKQKKEKIERQLYVLNKKIGDLTNRNLEGKLYGFLSIFSLVTALFFVSSNLTGNVIGALPINDMRWLSVCFFACGLFLAFFYLKDKYKKF